MGISIQCLTMNSATSVLILGIILHVTGHTQPPKNGIYSEYLRRLSSNQDQQPKESLGSTRQNELRPPQHVEPKHIRPKHVGDNPDYFSQAPPKTRDPFFGFHSFRGLPEDRTGEPHKEPTRPDYQNFRHPKTSPPISYGDPESNQYTPPMYRSSSKPHQIMPNKYGRHHFHSARPPYMTPGGQDRYSHEPTFPDFPQTTEDVPNVTDHPHTEGLDHPHTQGSDHPHTQGSDHPHTQGSDHPHTQGLDHPHTQGSDHQQTVGSDPPHTQSLAPDLRDHKSTQLPNDELYPPPVEGHPPGPPYRQLDPKELYSPFSSKPMEELQNTESERMRDESPGELPDMNNGVNVNETEHEYSLPSGGESDTRTYNGFTPSEELNMLANSSQTTPGTTSVELHGLNQNPGNPFSSSKDTGDTSETTTLSYEWPTAQSSTSVSVDFQPIRNMDKDTDVPERPEHNDTNSETYDYDSENKQEEFSDLYDDVYPDGKDFQDEYDDYRTEENSNETVNGTSTNEWSDHAEGVLYIGSAPSNESTNATDTVTDDGFIPNNGNTTVLASTDDEKHPVMILAIIIGVGVVLIVFIVIAIIIMNHLRRKIEEPKLLNFMHNNYCNLAETSFTTGFTNRAYEELDDQSSIAKSMESLAARKIASDSTKLVASYPSQMYGHFQNGGSRYGFANGGHAFPHDGFSTNNYRGKFKTPVEIEDDPDLNLTLAAVPVDKRDEAKSICSSESTDDLFVRNDFVNAVLQGMPNDAACLQQGDEGATECINPLYSSSHTLPISENDDQVSDDTAQHARDNYRNRFLENGGMLATSTPEAPPSGWYRTSSCPDCSIALDNLSDEVFFKPDFESAKTTDMPVARTKSTEDTGRSLSESNLVHHLAICNGNRDPSQVLNNQWEMRTGF